MLDNVQNLPHPEKDEIDRFIHENPFRSSLNILQVPLEHVAILFVREFTTNMLEVPVVRLRNSFYFILKRWLIKISLSVT
jgi:hypothetical protein